MATGTPSFAAWLLAACTVLPFHAAAGQQQQLLADVRESFGGFSWGTTADKIAAARGRPARDTLVRDFRHLVYRDTVGARPVDIRYLLHPARGLMAGHIEYEKLAECRDQFKEIRQEVERANSGLKKKNERKVRLEAVCASGMGSELGMWQLAWGDSGSARITQVMMTGTPQILVHYRGPEADAYLAAQHANRGPAIDGFASFAWGTPRDAILKKRGQPKRTDSTSSTVTLSYHDLLLGERAVLEFTTSPVEGLIRGTYWIPVPAGSDCDLFYRKFYFALVERFSDINPTVVRTGGTGKGFCEKVANGTGSLTAFWSDPKSKGIVTAELHRPGKLVRISYTGPNYHTWSERTREADVKSKL
jgi:hypothetical protein